MLVKLDVAVGYTLAVFIGHLGHLLAGLSHETVVDEPLTHKLLAELPLRFALGKTLLIALGIEVSAGVGRVNLVHEQHLAIALAEFIFRVNQNQSLAGGNLSASGKQSTSVLLHHAVIFLAHQSLGNDFLTRDVLVVPFLGFSCGRDDGLGETLILAHAVGQRHTTQQAAALLVLTPSTASEVTTNDHLHGETLASQAHGHHGVGSGQLPVGHYIGCGIKKFCGNLVQHLTFAGDAFGQNHIESADAVGSHHH